MRISGPGRLAALLCVVLVGGTLAACGSSSGASTTLTLYNGQHEQTTNQLVAAFEKQTGITVKVRNDDEDVLTNQILQEGSASPADLIYTENSPALEKLQERGVLAPVDRSTLNAVPSKYNSPQGDWVGVSARVNVVVYNTDQLHADQVPTSIMDLANPKWKGKLALAQGETDFQPIVTSIVAKYGKDAALTWLKAIKTNAGSNIYPNNETLVDQINKGQAQIGVLNSYYWYRRARSGRFGRHALGHLLSQPGRRRLPGRRLRCRRAQVEQEHGRRSEIPGLPGVQEGPGDHRPRRQLGVPDRLGRDHGQTAEALGRLAARSVDHRSAR